MRAIVSIIVVALIVILGLGMLLPWLMRGREDALRTSCLFNLHELHTALVLYHEQHDALPPAVARARGLAPEQRVSWLLAPLPFLGREDVYTLVDSRQGWAAPANQEALQMGITRYHCLAVVNRQQSRTNPVTHFLGLSGLGPDAARLPLDHPRAGAFGYWREVTLPYIKEWDGTSATLLVLEAGIENGPWLAGGRPTVRELDPARQPYLGSTGQFGGTHTAGAHALWADGSARIISPAITPRILEALVTIGGHEAAAGP